MLKEIEEKRALRHEVAHLWPLAATVHSCVLLDQDGVEFFYAGSGFGTVEGKVSYDALMAIDRMFGDTLQEGTHLFGLRISARIRIMALDAMRYIQANAKNGQPVEMLPVRVWLHKAFETGPWADPYDILVPSERRVDIPWNLLCEFLGISVPAIELDTDPREQARIARELVICTGLLNI